MRKASAALLVCITLLLGACSGDQRSAYDMRAVGFGQWREVLADYRPQIVVVDLWASWCSSCIERFPAMVEMAQRYAGKVQFVSLNLDDHTDDEALAWAQDFLIEQDARFDHYHLQENMMQIFEALDLLGIPAVLIYDGAGNERFRLTGDNPNDQFTERDVEQALQSLLKQS